MDGKVTIELDVLEVMVITSTLAVLSGNDMHELVYQNFESSDIPNPEEIEAAGHLLYDALMGWLETNHSIFEAGYTGVNDGE